MKKLLTCFLFLLLGLSLAAADSFKVRIKDVTRIKGQEKTILIGFGIITGLAGTGDSDDMLSTHTVANLLRQFNINIDEEEIATQNLAAVAITATINANAAEGDQVDINVSTMGDAQSLYGGRLLMAPVKGPDGTMWGVAQGAVQLGGFSFGDKGEGGNSVTKNHPTQGTVVGGLKLLKNVGIDANTLTQLTVYLANPDYESANAMTNEINKKFFGAATANNDKAVTVQIPASFRRDHKVPSFIAQLQAISFKADRRARIIFNEREGTIVIVGDVKISETSIVQGNISVNVKNTPLISQPEPFSDGITATANDQVTITNEEQKALTILPASVKLSELKTNLNKLGVSPREMMSIFVALHQAGALHAELISK